MSKRKIAYTEDLEKQETKDKARASGRVRDGKIYGKI